MDSANVTGWARRARDYVGVRGPDAAEYLQRMLSNDVEAIAPGESCEALLLTPKGRLIAPLVVLRRGEADYLLLTEEGLGEVLGHQLRRARFAAKVEIEPEEHDTVVVLGEAASRRARGRHARLRRAGVGAARYCRSRRGARSCGARAPTDRHGDAAVGTRA